jgi:hypothetical protein
MALRQTLALQARDVRLKVGGTPVSPSARTYPGNVIFVASMDFLQNVHGCDGVGSFKKRVDLNRLVG